jgi:hypothetical protein
VTALLATLASSRLYTGGADQVRQACRGDAPATPDPDGRDSAGAHELVELGPTDAEQLGGLMGREQQRVHVVLHGRGRADTAPAMSLCFR